MRTKNTSDLKSRRQELRKHSTPAEARLWQMLKGRQVEDLSFRRQYSVGHYILDFYCPELRLAIELDGDYHRSISNHDYERGEYLSLHHGIKTLRFENKVVFEHPEYILGAIKTEKQQQEEGAGPAKTLNS